MWREWLSFSKNELRGLFVLIGICMSLILVLMVGHCTGRQRDVIVVYPLNNLVSDTSEKLTFVDTLHLNYASVTEMDKFGFSDRLIINVLKYREAGGFFKSFKDFAKTYGFDSALLTGRMGLLNYDHRPGHFKSITRFNERSPKTYIHLYYSTAGEMRAMGCPDNYADTILRLRNQYYLSGTIKVDSLLGMDAVSFMAFIRSRILANKVKIVEETMEVAVVELNRADTADLLKVKGIGRYLADRILDYRKHLGGYVDVNQLLEVRGVSPDLMVQLRGCFIVDTTIVRTIPLNTSGVERLRNHPYVSFYLAKEIVERRRVKGRYTDVSQLFGLPSFEKANPLLIHYLSLEDK